MRLRYVAVSLMFVAAGTSDGQAARRSAQSGKSPEVRIDYTKETLPNGLTVLYHVDHSTPVAAVLLWYNVGSKMEQPGKTGFAHLFEQCSRDPRTSRTDSTSLCSRPQAPGRVLT